MLSKREIVNTLDDHGNKIKLAVIRPGHKIMQEANMHYNLKVSSLIRQGAENKERLLLRSELDEYMEKTGLWSQADVSNMQQYGIRIRAIELALQKGGIKLSQARQLALEMSKLRQKMMNLYNKKQQLDSVTVESVADIYRYGFLMVKCVVWEEDGKPFFVDYDDYMDRGDSTAAIDTSKQLAKMVYGLDSDITESLYENKWLINHGFMDKSGRLTNQEGKFVDLEGKLIDENGNFIDQEGRRVDKNGILVNDDGSFVVEDPKPFLDDEGKPITTNKPKKSKSNKKKKATAKAS